MSRNAMWKDRDFVLRQLKLLSRGRKMEASYHVSRVMEDNGFIKAQFVRPEGKGRTVKEYVPYGRGKIMLTAEAKRRARDRARKAEERTVGIPSDQVSN